MTDRTETIGVRVTPAEKKKFEEYLETDDGREHTSVSDLMRTASHRLVSEDDKADIDTEEIVNAVEVSLSDVTEQLDSMDSTLSVLLDSVRDDDEVSTLAARIYDHLPIYPNESFIEWKPFRGWNDEDSNHPDDPRTKIDDLETAREWSDVRAWADFFDESEEKTQRALSLMMTQYPDTAVAEADLGDGLFRRYYREEA